MVGEEFVDGTRIVGPMVPLNGVMIDVKSEVRFIDCVTRVAPLCVKLVDVERVEFDEIAVDPMLYVVL